MPLISPKTGGIAAAFVASGIWGLSGLYFSAVSEASAFEILSHRIIWSVFLTGALVWGLQRIDDFRAIFATAARRRALIASAVLIAANWLTFIWAIVNGHALEASLGYYIVPLIMLGLGRIFLAEQIRYGQMIALLAVAAGVANEVITFGKMPWVALIIALSFATYGLVRKTVPTDALAGLTAECVVLAPLAAGYLVYLSVIGEIAFLTGKTQLTLLLSAAGVLTTTPLLLFVIATKKLPLGVVGLIQYVNPSLQACVAVWVFHESFGMAKFVTFGLIWLGLALYSFEGHRHHRA